MRESDKQILIAYWRAQDTKTAWAEQVAQREAEAEARRRGKGKQ